MIKIFKPFCYIEIILGLFGIGVLIYNRPFHLTNITIVLLAYLSIVASLVIGMKLLAATENKTRLSEELNIFGHIGNCIKLLVVTGVLISAIYFFSATFKFITGINTRSLIYYAAMFLIIIWTVVSLFNFFAYIVIAKMNKRIRFSEIDDIGSETNSHNQ
jgi:hypothetical protein